MLPLVRETGDYFKFNDSLGRGGQLSRQESLIWLSCNVKVQEFGHTRLRATVQTGGGRPWGGDGGERQQSIYLCSSGHIVKTVLEQLSNGALLKPLGLRRSISFAAYPGDRRDLPVAHVHAHTQSAEIKIFCRHSGPRERSEKVTI